MVRHESRFKIKRNRAISIQKSVCSDIVREGSPRWSSCATREGSLSALRRAEACRAVAERAWCRQSRDGCLTYVERSGDIGLRGALREALKSLTLLERR
jgi:hypothetical protein